jgi:hypothetical protein
VSERTPFWASAAVLGALWGAVEVTLGGFLHTLRLPLVGVLLAVAEAGYLASARQLVPRRGFVLAVACVAALLKGLAPAGALLGPLVGIVAEGALLELAFLILPRPWIAAAVGGALGALWSLAQTVVVQLILFGGGVLRLYEALARAAGRAVGLHASAPVAALVTLLAGLALLGAVAGCWGVRLGRLARGRLDAEEGA